VHVGCSQATYHRLSILDKKLAQVDWEILKLPWFYANLKACAAAPKLAILSHFYITLLIPNLIPRTTALVANFQLRTELLKHSEKRTGTTYARSARED
jgi:hypothetical protein